MSAVKNTVNAFTQEEGDIHLGGIDAIVRLTLDQVRTDARRGLKTGMFVSGYRGSPVGMLDAGMTVELYDSEGKAMVMNAGAYSGEGSIIKRSQASPMASFAYVPQYKAAFLASTSQAGAYRNVFADIFEMETYLEYNLSDEVAPVQYAFDNVVPDPADEANPGSRMFRLQGWTPVFYAVGIKLPSYRLEAGETISGAIVTTNLDTDNSASEPGEVKVLKKTASRAWLVGGEGEPAGIDRAGFIIMLTED